MVAAREAQHARRKYEASPAGRCLTPSQRSKKAQPTPEQRQQVEVDLLLLRLPPLLPLLLLLLQQQRHPSLT